MQTLRGENKIAILLTSLPRMAAESVLARLGTQRGDRLRGLMEQARTEASPELTDTVLREFEEALLQATRGASTLPRLAAGTTPDSAANGQATDQSASDLRAAANVAIDDPIAQLQLIDSDRLAAALQGEHPRGVATVLSCLDAGAACEALKRLPPEVRKDVFPRLGQAAGGADDVSLRIVRAVVAKTRAAADAPATSSTEGKAQKMADMLKAMERTERMELMTVLEAQDAALAAAVRDRLYVFDDLVVIADRSLQKLLAEVDSKALALALKGAAENISAKVMGNLSKRARETLTEEIGFLGDIPAAQVQQAQKIVVEVIQRLDQAGELVMMR